VSLGRVVGWRTHERHQFSNFFQNRLARGLCGLNPAKDFLSHHASLMVSSNTELAYNSKVEGQVVVSRADAVINWIRTNSIWPMPMGLACCAIELMAVGNGRFDIARFGAEVMRFSPRQSDCMIVAGSVTYKMAPQVRRIYDQMMAPKWVIAMGACASSGGMYRSYAHMQGVDRIIPVDVYISGCPPRPEAIIDAIIKLQAKIRTEPAAKNLLKASA
jgi:NADH-quinone oxidoreductase subunit B